jgi:hypothetical protein
VAPSGRHFAQGNQHKGAGVHARVRELRRAVLDTSVIIEKVNVKRSGRVGLAALASESSLYLVKDR